MKHNLNLLACLVSVTIDCGPVPDIQDGRVDFSGGTTLGSTITYSCNTGYTLTGDANRTCQANRTYDGSEPTCEGEISLTIH